MEYAVYWLNYPADDERWGCFVIEDESSVLGLKPTEYQKGYELDFVPFAPKHRNWKPHRLKEVWKPKKVHGNVKPYNDYPVIAGVVPLCVFSQKAVDALRDLLEPNGELLPLITPPELGPYYAYNTTTVCDVLDIKRSSGVEFYCEDRDAFLIAAIDRYEFVADKLVGQSIFQLPEFPGKVYVTEVFAQRVREHKLWGMLLNKVWPLASGVHWQKLATENARNHLTPAGQRRFDGPPPKKSRTVGKVSSGPLGDEDSAVLQEAREAFASELGVIMDSTSIEQIQELIHEDVARLQLSMDTAEEKKERAILLAVAWGDTLVKSLQWEWVMLNDEGGNKGMAVASSNRSHAVPVIAYFYRLVSTGALDNTSLLLFRMIRAGDSSTAKANALKILV